MTLKLLAFLTTVFTTLAAPSFAGGGATGIWQTEVDDGAYAHITIAPCGNALCGTISRTFNSDGEFKSENIGKKIVTDMVAQDETTYDGKVFRPSNGKTYTGTMSVNGDYLTLKGCVLGGLICAGQNWVRISK